MQQDSVRLDDVFARQTDVQWYEGVAVVQGVCRQLLDNGTSTAEFPTPGDIALGRDGAVRILGTSSTQPLPAAAHLLAGMLGDGAPVRLRLAVMQSTGEQTEGNLRSFSEALAYFERPDAQAIIRALVERVMVAPYRADRNERASAGFNPKPAPTQAVPQSSNAKSTRQRVVIVGAALLLIVVGALGVAATRTGRVAAAITGVKEELSSAPAAAEKGNSTPEVSKQSATGSASPMRRQGKNMSVTTAGAQAQPASLRAIGVMPSLLLRPSVPDSKPLTTDPVSGDVASFYEVVTISPDAAGTADPIYSTSDSDVLPPSQIYPAFPSNRPSVVDGPLTVVELVIGTDGLVERVRLRTAPKDVREFMLLSAAKAWRFKPATSSGRPVRFRHTVAITGS